MNIVLSIKPKFTSLILDGSKTIEMRTKIGKKFVDEASIIIYSSTPVKAIVAIAKINKIQYLQKDEVGEKHLENICISRDFFNEYMDNRTHCYLLELKDVKKLKKPLTLQYLKTFGFIAPQSFCYPLNNIQELVKSSL